MFSSFRNRFGIPGVISVIALVFAMMGGAYAASNDSGKATASAKGKKGPRGPRGPAGPAGPQGPAGPAGAKGDKGDTGTAGSNGSNGAAGAAGPTGPTGASGAAGAKGATGATGVTGPTGPTGPAGTTLPSGKTLTGIYANRNKGVFALAVPISYPLRLTFEPTTHFVGEGPPDPECPGSAENPEAAPGHLCLYGLQNTNVEPLPIINGGGIADRKGGALAVFLLTEEAKTEGFEAIATGSWAVTAP